MAIITSLLDTDLYKLTQSQTALHQGPNTQVKFAFKCRSAVDLRPFENQIRDEINSLGNLRFTEDELDYLRTIRYLTPDFIEFLSMLRLTPEKDVFVRSGAETLEIEVQGTWHTKIFYEIYKLAIVGAVYHGATSPNPDFDGGIARVREKCALINAATRVEGDAFRLIEFGTRRRFSQAWQERVLQELIANLDKPNLFGTSNVRLAMIYGLRPIGTMAHELFQAAQGMNVKLEDSQKHALEMWTQEFRGDLGIALTDIFGMDAFLADFDMFFAKLFDGCRHDSGDPVEWTYKLLAHYGRLGIDARTKAAVYSDGLDIPKALALWVEFRKLIRTSFGIGTNLTCDIPGVNALQIVSKMTECNGSPVAKVSDSPGKGMCKDSDFEQYLRSRIEYKVQKAREEGRI